MVFKRFSNRYNKYEKLTEKIISFLKIQNKNEIRKYFLF